MGVSPFGPLLHKEAIGEMTMIMEVQNMQIADRQCYLYKGEDAEYLLIQPTDEHDLEVLDAEVRAIQERTDKSFSLVAFEVRDWQSELTPWSAPAVFGKMPFGDGAVGTLSFVTGVLVPWLTEHGFYLPNSSHCLLGGYSLAGLFALWVGYQSDFFGGIAAVSPSVWYPHWVQYAEKNHPCASSVYLSLGDMEERTRNPIMAQVGNSIRCQYQLLQNQEVNTLLEWNPGNHFKDSAIRMAKGFAWLLS